MPLSRRPILGLGSIAIAIAAACTKDGRSVVPVDLTAAADVSGLESVDLSLTDGADIVERVFEWKPVNGTLKIGLYAGTGLSGQATLAATGKDAAGKAIAEAKSTMVAIKPGRASELVKLALYAI